MRFGDVPTRLARNVRMCALEEAITGIPFPSRACPMAPLCIQAYLPCHGLQLEVRFSDMCEICEYVHR